METIRTKYLGNLRTEAMHVASGNKLITDAPLDNHGRGEAFSPTDLLCASLGSCMMTVMAIAAQTHQIDMEGCAMKITKVMQSQPRKVIEIIIEMDLSSKVYTEKERMILERAGRTCPVSLSLDPELQQNIKFIYTK